MCWLDEFWMRGQAATDSCGSYAEAEFQKFRDVGMRNRRFRYDDVTLRSTQAQPNRTSKAGAMRSTLLQGKECPGVWSRGGASHDHLAARIAAISPASSVPTSACARLRITPSTITSRTLRGEAL